MRCTKSKWLLLAFTTVFLSAAVEEAVASIQAGYNPDGRRTRTMHEVVRGEVHVGRPNDRIVVSSSDEAGPWTKRFKLPDPMPIRYDMQRYSDGSFGLHFTPIERSISIHEHLRVGREGKPWIDWHESILRPRLDLDVVRNDMMASIKNMLPYVADYVDVDALLPRWEWSGRASVRAGDREVNPDFVKVTKNSVWVDFVFGDNKSPTPLRPGTAVDIWKEATLLFPTIHLARDVFNDQTYDMMTRYGMPMTKEFMLRIPDLVVGEYPSVIPEPGSLAVWFLLSAIGVTSCSRRCGSSA